MSDINFTPFCGNPFCFSQINHRGGLVLSCGCFLCKKCGAAFNELCPGCKSRGVRALSLTDLPPDVAAVACDTALDFEKLFTALKFQIKHYKNVISVTTGIIQRQNTEIEKLRRVGDSSNQGYSTSDSGSLKRKIQQPLPWKSSTEMSRAAGSQSHSGHTRPPASSEKVPGNQSVSGGMSTPRRPLTPTNVHSDRDEATDGKLSRGITRWGPSHPSTPLSAATRATPSYTAAGRPDSRGTTIGTVSIGNTSAHKAGYTTPSRVRSPYTQLTMSKGHGSSSVSKHTKIGQVVSQRDLRAIDENRSPVGYVFNTNHRGGGDTSGRGRTSDGDGGHRTGYFPPADGTSVPTNGGGGC